jgi:hypothetical protein
VTIHEEAAELLLDEMLSDDRASAVLNATVRKFRQRDYDPRYVTAIGQMRQDPAYWPLPQVAAYLSIHAGINSGEYALFTVATRGEPGPDADRDGNAAKLANLKRPFAAHLDMAQNAADQDGQFFWNKDVRSTRSTGLPAINGCESVPVTIPYRLYPAMAPLEVGTTLPSRTLAHLRVEGRVAHWPYGSRQMTVLVAADRNWSPSEETP